MLKFNQEQMKVFENLQFLKLKRQIFKELSSRVPKWKQYDEKKKLELVDSLFAEANKAKMIFEIEYILFSLLCMSSKSDAESFLKSDSVQNILSDENTINTEKLIKLSKLTSIRLKNKMNGWEVLKREDCNEHYS